MNSKILFQLNISTKSQRLYKGINIFQLTNLSAIHKKSYNLIINCINKDTKRCITTSLTNKETIEQPSNLNQIESLGGKSVFISPSGRAVGLVKKFSFITSVLGVTSLPLFSIFWQHPWVQESGLSYSTVVIACISSLASTSFMHWFCGPYVKRMFMYPDPEPTIQNQIENEPNVDPIENQIITQNTKITFETNSLLGNAHYTTVNVGMLKMGRLPYVTWKLQDKYIDSKINRELMKQDIQNFNQTKFWIDLPYPKAKGYKSLYGINNFLKDKNFN